METNKNSYLHCANSGYKFYFPHPPQAKLIPVILNSYITFFKFHPQLL